MTGPPVASPWSDPARLRSIWQQGLRARAQGYTTKQIDAATQEALGVDFPTLTRQLMVAENVADPETRASPLAPFDPTQAEQAKVSPAAVAMLTPLLGGTLGLAERLSPTLREYGQMANRSAPLNAAVGRLTGGAVTGAASSAIPTPNLTGTLAPFQEVAQGAIQGAPLGLLGAYAQQPDLLNPNLGSLAKGAAATAAAGGALGLIGGMGSRMYNPAEQNLKIGIERSVPDQDFNFERGLQALEPPSGAPPVLQPLMAEKPNLGLLATKYVRQSQVAATQAKNLIENRLQVVRDAKNAIANDPQSGYDAILSQTPMTDPRAVGTSWYQGLQRQTKGDVPTGRDVFNLYKRLQSEVQSAEKARARGSITEAQKQSAYQAGQTADEIAPILNDVPGFPELQAKMAPYLEREKALNNLSVQLQGRGVYLKGKMPSPPPRGVREKVLEALQATSPWGTERAARSLVPALYGTTTPDALLGQVNALQAMHSLRLLPNLGAGATAGLLGTPQLQDRLGLP